MNNVYSSSDVVNWKQVLSAEWPPRSRFGAVAFHDNIWVLGGFALYDDEPYYGMSDVWRLPLAPDISLAIETGHAPWYQIGEPLNLKVVGTGLSGEETYDWQKDGSPLTDQTNSAYHVDALALSDAGSYACLVNDPANTGTLTAGPVSIMVLPPGYRLPLVSVIGVLLIIISAAIGVRAINFRRT
jgi:hypothetical protein